MFGIAKVHVHRLTLKAYMCVPAIDFQPKSMPRSTYPQFQIDSQNFSDNLASISCTNDVLPEGTVRL